MSTASLPVPPKRADARRNFDAILLAAEEEVARHGADASLEEIARRAKVGSATLHRHFASRGALMQAVFHDRVEVLCARAAELEGAEDPTEALRGWLVDVAEYGATTRGLARSLSLSGAAVPPADDTCEGMLLAAGHALLQKAQHAGGARGDTTEGELLTLVNAVSLATENSPHAAADARRLATLALEGLKPPRV